MFLFCFVFCVFYFSCKPWPHVHVVVAGANGTDMSILRKVHGNALYVQMGFVFCVSVRISDRINPYS